MKSEAQFTSQLIDAMVLAMPRAVIFKHADISTSGVPDISCSWNHTLWVEVKATEAEQLETHKAWGLQHLTCRRIERMTGLCRFVVYREINSVESIIVAKPSRVTIGRVIEEAEILVSSYAHHTVAAWLRQLLLMERHNHV